MPAYGPAGQGAEPEDEGQDDGGTVWVGQRSLLLPTDPGHFRRQ